MLVFSNNNEKDKVIDFFLKLAVTSSSKITFKT